MDPQKAQEADAEIHHLHTQESHEYTKLGAVI